MEHAPEGRVLQHDPQTVPVGLPVVDDDGQVQLQGQVDLAAEHLLLEFLRRVLLPVVVQADLPDGHHLLVGAQGADGVEVGVGAAGTVLRVEAHGGVDVGKFLRQSDGRPGGGHVAPRVHHKTHSGLRQSGEDRLPVGVEGAGVIVGVGIENGHENTSYP